MTLKAPFPWFGGRRRVADVVWCRPVTGQRAHAAVRAALRSLRLDEEGQ